MALDAHALAVDDALADELLDGRYHGLEGALARVADGVEMSDGTRQLLLT